MIKKSPLLYFSIFTLLLIIVLALGGLVYYLKSEAEIREKKIIEVYSISKFQGEKVYDSVTDVGDYKLYGLQGVVTKKYKNNEGEWIVELEQKDFDNLNVLLGKDEEILGVLYTDGLTVPKEAEWTTNNISEIVGFVDEKEPLIVVMSFAWNKTFTDQKCLSSACETFMQRIKKYEVESNSALNELLGGKYVQKKMLVGATQLVVEK